MYNVLSISRSIVSLKYSETAPHSLHPPYERAMACLLGVNTLRPRQNSRHFADQTFKRIFLNETFRILIKISLKFVPKGPINNIPALVQIMAWRRSSDKPLSEPMMVRLLTYICVTGSQWVNSGNKAAAFFALYYVQYRVIFNRVILWYYSTH